MKENVSHIDYSPGIFDKFKNEKNLDEWCKDFPDLMWGLGYDMDCHASYNDFLTSSNLVLTEVHSKREEYRNCLYALEHAPRQVVGNFLFSQWRFYTHWCLGGYDEYDVDFLMRIIKILEDDYGRN